MVGKQVSTKVYAHVLLVPELAEPSQTLVNLAVQLAGLTPDADFNIARIDPEHDEVALLSYPEFFTEPFPSLAGSWRVHFPTQSVTYRDYRSSLNPPILHRKELMLPKTHPACATFSAITAHAESLGLFADPIRIGFRQQWESLIASKGYALRGNDFLPLGNLQPETELAESTIDDPVEIERHRTALSRQFLSAPVQALIRLGVLRPGRTFFDYGCGRGDDVCGLRSLGYEAHGWDPHFLADAPKIASEVVNLGFVINVIEHWTERVDALVGAYSLTKGVLVASAMLWSSSTPRGRPFSDGILTSRNTFQRYYHQAELQTFIESVLEDHAYPIGPGIFFVFKDRSLENQFQVSRQVDPTRAPRLLAQRSKAIRPREVEKRKAILDDPQALSVIDAIWRRALELGRVPEPEDCPDDGQAIRVFGSWHKAIRSTLSTKDLDVLRLSTESRADELRLVFASQILDRRARRLVPDPALRRDIRALFGSLAVAEAEGMRFLKSAASVEVILRACQDAASRGLGYLDGVHSLQLHTSLAAQLPSVLRVYLASAIKLYGDVSSADVVKLHIQSGKVTLMRFDSFADTPLPRLRERVKVNLREQDLEYFEYGEAFAPPFLYYKSKYINEEYSRYPEQVAFDQALRDSQLVPAEGYGPSEVELIRLLRAKRLRIDGFNLVPSSGIPDLDEKCGAVFTYRELIECGETWSRLAPRNVPRNPETYNALCALAISILDPVVDYFGAIELTYGFCSAELASQISSGIAPTLDQHASCETRPSGKLICTRRGAAVDFLVRDEDMREVARWIRDNCEFDRMYFYGSSRPLHVSIGPDNSRAVYELTEKNGRRTPRRLLL